MLYNIVLDLRNSNTLVYQFQVFHPSEKFVKNAHLKSLDDYKAMHKKSVDDPEGFWKDIVKQFHFERPQSEGKPFLHYNFNIKNGPIEIKWLEGSTTNICYNVLDRNVKDKGLKDTIAFYWYAGISNACS